MKSFWNLKDAENGFVGMEKIWTCCVDIDLGFCSGV